MNARQAVRRVLSDAGDAAGFFDMNDAERMTWMIERAYRLGRQAGRGKGRGKGHGTCEETSPLPGKRQRRGQFRDRGRR